MAEASSPCLPEPPAGTERTLEANGSLMLYVPAGEFIMGSAEDDPLSSDGEYPQHTVYLEGFWIGQTGGASSYGALDVAGNVWEWCATIDHDNYG